MGVDRKKGEREGLSSGVYRRAEVWQKGKQAWQSYGMDGKRHHRAAKKEREGVTDVWVPHVVRDERQARGHGRGAGLCLGRTVLNWATLPSACEAKAQVNAYGVGRAARLQARARACVRWRSALGLAAEQAWAKMRCR